MTLEELKVPLCLARQDERSVLGSGAGGLVGVYIWQSGVSGREYEVLNYTR